MNIAYHLDVGNVYARQVSYNSRVRENTLTNAIALLKNELEIHSVPIEK